MNKKQQRELQKELALSMYMSNASQTEIADKVEVSRPTINKWIVAGNWAERRAAKNISRPELANKLLKSIATLIDKINASNDDEAITGGSIDKLSKMAAAIEKLDKKAGVVDSIEVFIAFGKWLDFQRTMDPALTDELVKTFNEYQNKYISELMSLRINK